MEQVKKLFSKVDFHLNVAERTLSIRYGVSSIVLRITEDGKVKLETALTLEGLLGQPEGSDVPSES